MNTPIRRPLDGMLVLDLGQIYNGPCCGLPLGVMGARVLEIESPEGDVVRRRQRDVGRTRHACARRRVYRAPRRDEAPRPHHRCRPGREIAGYGFRVVNMGPLTPHDMAEVVAAFTASLEELRRS